MTESSWTHKTVRILTLLTAMLLCLAVQGAEKQAPTSISKKQRSTLTTPTKIIQVQQGVKLRLQDDTIIGLKLSDKIKDKAKWQDLIGSKQSSLQLASIVSPGTSAPHRSIDDEEVTPQTWRKLKLVMAKGDGSIAKIELLRPMWWLKQNKARGGRLWLNLPEMGLHGWAKVLSIGPCKADSRKRPPGSQVVTGKFTHDNATVYDLYFEGLQKPIGVTPNHPFFSYDRKGWIAAAKLEIRERVLTRKQGAIKLLKREKRPGKFRVNNLEVHREHTYFVSSKSILAHNNCFWNLPRELRNAYNAVMDGNGHRVPDMSGNPQIFQGRGAGRRWAGAAEYYVKDSSSGARILRKSDGTMGYTLDHYRTIRTFPTDSPWGPFTPLTRGNNYTPTGTDLSRRNR